MNNIIAFIFIVLIILINADATFTITGSLKATFVERLGKVILVAVQ